MAVLLFLYSCSAQKFTSSQPELKLLPPAEGPKAVLLKRRITLQRGGKQVQFLLVARFDQNRLKLVGLSPTGQKLLVLDYDGEELVQETSLWVDVPGKEILAVIQFALWPGQSINNWYPEKEGWQVDISSEKRILLTVAGVLLNISYEGEKIIIDNYLHEYRVLVHMLEKKEL